MSHHHVNAHGRLGHKPDGKHVLDHVGKHTVHAHVHGGKISKVTFTGPDGHEHELKKVASNTKHA